ncbi:acyltransferase family protein [Anaerotruncus rubiinfantis]|uniref:acyltransferase family protein n=1 Tax=Anaerotruncus rubiinfantis TaxID=1720200 RepID=UPI00082F9351
MDAQQTENIVEVQNVSMRFNLSREKVDNLKEYVVKMLKRQLLFDEFYALRNVSFTVKRGEPFAIIGENGCGKSTLLKVISGIFYPTKGSVTVRGSVAPLIELGAGFDMDLTARENIFLNGAVLGYDTAFMESKYQEIMDFAELWDFADVPVKNFSSGMVARLGFSIATMVVPDILIVDEILAVGDFLFQQKCERKMQEMIDAGATLIFVSHSSDQVKKLCKRAVWLKRGVVQMIGDAGEVTDAYIHDMETGGHGLVSVAESEAAAQEIAPQRPPVPTPPKKEYPFLNFLRVLALAMVVWDHLGPFRNPDWRLGQLVENTLNRPLGIVQSFGGFGVILFFLVSGYLLAAGGGGGRLAFGVKRVLRIFPPLILSFASFYLFQYLVSLVTGPTWWAQFSPRQWVMGATLANYFVGVPDVINGTTWFLFPTLLFYLLGFLFYPWIRCHPFAVAVAMEAVLAGGYCAALWLPLPDAARNVIELSWYVAFPVCGMLLYYLKEGKIGFWSFAVLGAVDYLLLLKGIAFFKPDYYEQSPYLISFAYAFLLFAVAMLLDEKLRPNTLVDGVAELSFSVYLTHMTYGSLAMTLLAPRTGYTAAFLLTLVFVFLVAALHYRLVEKPAATLSRRLLQILKGDP